jgi:hypothetical protein
MKLEMYMKRTVLNVYYMVFAKLFKKSFLGRSHMGTLGAKTSQWHPLQVAPRARAPLAIT